MPHFCNYKAASHRTCWGTTSRPVHHHAPRTAWPYTRPTISPFETCPPPGFARSCAQVCSWSPERRRSSLPPRPPEAVSPPQPPARTRRQMRRAWAQASQHDIILLSITLPSALAMVSLGPEIPSSSQRDHILKMTLRDPMSCLSTPERVLKS